MTTRSYHLYRYSIPVDSQVVLRNRFLKKREGLLVQIKCGEHEGWGEIAPLPEFSEETLEQAQQQTALWLKNQSAVVFLNVFISFSPFID